ncbi:MAG: hypothetical protein TR69_WS6001000649 [candidate division WS6 bacterium OLB20]|uniref:Uncharacterized protein n=1 Tax=candidate division WS6 bacterium OLB20 TaxID=1617426 RepID=A0A136LY98_9BACT|nr:MAG: hypothetical protein TR69_WS6001000649 [candidate division WS6 bacterium OLB20]
MELNSHTRKNRVLLTIFALLALCFVVLVSPVDIRAAVASTLNFQGKIVNRPDGTNLITGTPSCVAAGADTCDLRVSIYSDPVGGTLLWREPHENIELGDYEGVFSLSLNSVCGNWESPGGSCSGSGLSWGDDSSVYVEIEFDDDGNGDFSSAETFSRKQLTTVPFAYEAERLGGIASSGFVQLSPASIQATGNVTTPLIYLNEDGANTPNLIQMQVASSDVFTVSNTGDITTIGDLNVNGGGISSSAVLTFNDSLTGDIAFSDGSNTSLPAGTNSILHALNAASGGGGGLWTINANVTYLTSSGSDLSLSSTLVSAFSVDESENLARIGDGSSGNAKLDFYSSSGDTGRFEYIGDLLQWSGGSQRIVDNISLNFGTNDDIQIYYDETTDDRLELSDGTNVLLALTDVGTTGNLTVSGTMNVGGSILSLGAGSNDRLATSAAGGAATNPLYWGNQTVCLANGSGCNSDYGLWESLTFNSGSNTGTFENDFDVIIGTYSGDNTPLTNTSFVLDSATADDMYILDLLGVGDSLYVENNIVAGSGLTIADSGISDSNSSLTLSSSGGTVVVSDTLDVTGGSINVTGGGILIQNSTAQDLIIDNSTTGATADSGAMILRGNYFNVSNTEIDMRVLLDIISDTDYRLSFLNDGSGAEVASIDQSGNLQVDGNINIGTDTADVLGVGPASAANGDLYWGEDLICDVSESNCGIAFGGSSLFTDGGTISYLTQTSDDLAIGASNTLVAPFSVDVSANVVRIGDGENDANTPMLAFYASDATNDGSIQFLDTDTFEFAGGDVYISGGDFLLGATAETIAGGGFTLSGDDAFINGDLGVEGNIYSDGDIDIQTDVDTTGAGDIAINFGGTNTEVLAWRASLDSFEITDDLQPSVDDTYDLGANARRWRDLYLGPATLHIGTSTSDEGTISYNTTTNDLTIESDGDLVLQNSGGLVGIGGVTAPTAILDIAASTASNAHINFTPGTNPTTPNSGDIWFNGTNLNFYDGSSTVDLLAGAASLLTDGGTFTYLTETTDDFVLGSNLTTGPFFFDVSAGRLRLNTTGASAGIEIGNDTLLYDGGTNLLITPDALTVQGQLTASATGVSGGIVIGNDTNLYDNGTNVLQTDDTFTVGGALNVTGGAGTFTGGNVVVQGTAPFDIIIDNSTTGATADSGALVLRGNYFNVSNTEIDMSVLLDIVSDTDYRISFYNDGETTEVGSIDESGNLQIDGDLNLGTDTADVLSVGTVGAGANGDLYWGDDLLCDVSEANCGISFGGGSLFTDSGSITYLSQAADDFAVGGSTLASSFSVDVDTNTVRIGTGATANGVLNMFASDGDTGAITFTTDDRWEFSGGNVLLADDQSMFFGTNADAFFRYDETTDDRLEFGFGANQFGYINDVAAMTYGDFLFSGTTTLGTALAANETALYINPASGYTGTLLDIDINGADIFSISATGIRADVPATFASVGDVQIANDLVFTNSTASSITSDSPFYITAGDLASDEDLVLSANNAGYVVVDDRLEVADLIHLGNGSANNYLSTSAQANPATTDLYWGDKLVCDASETNCGFSSFLTDAGSATYLTSVTDDFAVGGTGLGGSFSVDVSDNLVRVGTGATANGKIDLYASNGNTGRLEFTTADILELNNSGFVFNQSGDSVDFVIEGDTDASLFYADGSADRIGIGVATPDAWLDIKAPTAGSAQINLTPSASVDPSAPVNGDLWYNGTNLYFYNGSTSIDLLAANTSVTLQPGSAQTASGANTIIAINETNAGNPNLIDIEVAGNTRFRVDNTGQGYFGGDTPSDSYTHITQGGVTGYSSGIQTWVISSAGSGQFFAGLGLAGGATIDLDSSVWGGTGGEFEIYSDQTDVFIDSTGNISLDATGGVMLNSGQDTTAAGDITLSFGGTNTETFRWDSTNDGFALSDDITVSGNVVITGASAGIVYANVATGSAPTCDSSTVGTTIYNRDAAEDGTIYLCRQNSGGTYEWRDMTNGSGTPDIAEYVKTADTSISAGDIVSVSTVEHSDENLYNRFLVEKSDSSSRDRVLGVISTNPGLTLNPSTPDNELDYRYFKPLALAGRVPVKIASTSQPIAKGDALSVSDVPGRAQKATGRGMVIGTALESWEPSSGQATVLLMINNTWYEPDAGPMLWLSDLTARA